MDVVADLPADPQTAEPVQVGERALHNPALPAEAGPMLAATAGYQRLHAEVPDETAVLVVVVAAVTQHHIGAAAGPAPLAPHRRHGLEERDELGDVVAVAAGQGDGERNAGGIGD